MRRVTCGAGLSPAGSTGTHCFLTSPRHAYSVAERLVTDHHSRNTRPADPAKLAGPPPSRARGSRGLPPGQHRGHGSPPLNRLRRRRRSDGTSQRPHGDRSQPQQAAGDRLPVQRDLRRPPLGVEMKSNIKRQWWKSMVTERDDIVGIDSCVILAPEVWQASGHVTEFVDPLTECQSCHRRFRADHLIEAYQEKHEGKEPAHGLADLACPNCGTRGAFTEPRMFNGLLRTYLGATEDESGLAYLRPETAQGIFINFKNVQQTSRKKIPFGIAQIGKSFRNEITPGNFIFRTREFEQMEMEFFVKPGTDEEWHEHWIQARMDWYLGLGLTKENLRLYEHPAEKRSFYSKRT